LELAKARMESLLLSATRGVRRGGLLWWLMGQRAGIEDAPMKVFAANTFPRYKKQPNATVQGR
jgi:hypothetical protein